jgi:hypothetical protein
MPNKNLFRIAAWCVLVVVLINLADFVLFPSGKPTVAELILEVLLFLVLAFVFYALYVAHRVESPGLSLAGLVLSFVSVAVNLASLGNFGNTFLSNASTLLLSLPFLIFGFLAWRSARMPRGLAIVTLLAGAFFLIGGVAGFIGSATVAGVAGLASLVFMLVWAVWLWRVLLSNKFTAASPESPAA